MTPETSLLTPSFASASVHICKNCKRELPPDSFYVNKTTLCPDKFCKECRKSLSRRQYSNGKRFLATSPGESSYPVITQIEDRETRIRFILHALRVVQSRVECKKKKMQEAEAALL